MLAIFRNRTYRHLFAAQVIALLGTGLATVALGLLAFEIAGEEAGLVLGTALAIKMVAYVGIAPVASAGFTPTFQATIPDVLPDEAEYTRALSLSRLAYDLESLVSPMLAAALLTVVSSSAAR